MEKEKKNLKAVCQNIHRRGTWIVNHEGIIDHAVFGDLKRARAYADGYNTCLDNLFPESNLQGRKPNEKIMEEIKEVTPGLYVAEPQGQVGVAQALPAEPQTQEPEPATPDEGVKEGPEAPSEEGEQEGLNVSA